MQLSKKKFDQYLKFSALGIQIALVLVILAYLGKWVDERTQRKDYLFTAIFSVFGLAASLVSTVISLKKINENK